MATPIKSTPVISGADARRFEKDIENPPKIPAEKREEMFKSYEWFKQAATFPV